MAWALLGSSSAATGGNDINRQDRLANRPTDGQTDKWLRSESARECVWVRSRESGIAWSVRVGGGGRFSCSSLSLKQNLRHEPESRQVVACFTTLGSRAVACAFPPLCPYPNQGPADKGPNPDLKTSTQYGRKLWI